MTAPDLAAAGTTPLRHGGRIAIRPLGAADVPEARRLEQAAYGAANPRTEFERELRNGLVAYLAAVEAGEAAAGGGAARLLGFAGVWYTHEQLHLVTLAVDPRERRRGIGRALTLAVRELAVEAELDSVALEARASNEGALRLYERCGFRRAGRLRRYYADGEDAIVMLLDGLTPSAPCG